MWRRVEMLAEGLAVVACLFAGIFVPVGVMPGWLASIAAFSLGQRNAERRGSLSQY